MSTVTARLQLTKAVGSESMVLGAAQLTDAYSKIDAAMGVKKFATQGAATAVFEGDLIKETSTGQSKVFHSPNWLKIYDPADGSGQPQSFGTGAANSIVSFSELLIFSTTISVTAGRRYLGNYSLALSALDGGGDPTANKGFCRVNFKYGTNLALDPNILVHDVASWVSAINASKSKNLKGSFEFFPNITAQVKFGMTAELISGNENLELNLSGTNPNMYFIDWGV